MGKNKEFFDFLQASSLDGLWYWDLETGNDEWMSPRFWEVLGYDPKEKQHLASEWKDLIFPEDLQCAIENFHKHCADSNHPYDQIVRYHHKSGATVWVRCRGLVIRNDEGKPIRMLGAHTDVTAQKLVEQQLRETNEKLNKALDEINTLQGIIPICANCKKIRDEKGFWDQVEAYISQHSNALFSHSICPDCAQKLYPDLYAKNTAKDKSHKNK